LIRNYLVVAFVVAFTVALAAPAPGQAVLKPQVVGVHVVTFINICLVVRTVRHTALLSLYPHPHPHRTPHPPTPPPPPPTPPPPPQFVISGLTLRTDELKTALTRRNAVGTVFGFVSIVGVTPLLAFAVRGLPFAPPEYATGLALFCIVPTTLGVGVSLVTSAKVGSRVWGGGGGFDACGVDVTG
jgi:sodium/bile acid cotransporter 7